MMNEIDNIEKRAIPESKILSSKHEGQKIDLAVKGMTCAACVRRVENALKEVEGVVEVSVNLATARATVIHASHWAGLPALARAVAEHGYEFLGELKDSFDDPVEKARKRDLKELTFKVICGAILSVIIFFGSMQHWFGFLHFIPRQAMLIAMFVLTAPAVFWVGRGSSSGRCRSSPPSSAPSYPPTPLERPPRGFFVSTQA